MKLGPSVLTERAFADRRRRDWDELAELTALATSRGLARLTPAQALRISPLYRSVCADLAAAEAARYSAPLVDYLRSLTARMHALVYGPHARADSGRAGLRTARSAWLFAFPRAVRKYKVEMLLAAALFFVPFVVGALVTLRDPLFAFRVAPEGMLRPLARAYAEGFQGRDPGEGAMMAGFYVYNNVGIALRCFALGIFGGLGSAFYLVQNGLSIGAILGFVASEGAGQNLVTFIVGHGSLELGAIVLSGGAGLSLGWSLVAPGDLPRVVSLQRRARELLVVVAGSAVMLFLAAALEAFWSASSTPREVKLAVGGALFATVVGYLLLGGRGHPPGERLS